MSVWKEKDAVKKEKDLKAKDTKGVLLRKLGYAGLHFITRR
jgi:hypothetical protein